MPPFKGAAYSGNTTIDTTELQKEFGKYVSSERMQIMKDLVGTTESIRYMSTIVTDKTEVRATQAAITSVLQQFRAEVDAQGKEHVHAAHHQELQVQAQRSHHAERHHGGCIGLPLR